MGKTFEEAVRALDDAKIRYSHVRKVEPKGAVHENHVFDRITLFVDGENIVREADEDNP